MKSLYSRLEINEVATAFNLVPYVCTIKTSWHGRHFLELVVLKAIHILLNLEMTDIIPCTTLHELASKTFSRTPNGVIFTDDIKMIYSTFLICLNLKEESPELKRWYSPFGKSHHAFSFSMEEGVERMGNLKLSVDMTTTSIEICYNIQPELAYHLIRTFMEAKLLHTPADRTRSMPKNKSILQPTPKGVGILQKYVRRIGLKSLPPILLSDFNSMEIFTFERSPVTDSIIYSNRLICILLNKMMGSGPNVWSPETSPDKIPSLSKLLEYNSDIFSFETVDYKAFGGFEREPEGHQHTSWFDELSTERLHDENRTSPLAHRFFTNPDSDSHVQYYSTDCGLRISKSKIFGSPKVLFDYCFTTKAIWQWVMDCTDIMYPKEAVSAAALFLKAGLVVPILFPPSENLNRKFCISRTSYYTLSRRAWDVVQWNTEKGIRRSICNFSNLLSDDPNKHNSVATSINYKGEMVMTERPGSSLSDSDRTTVQISSQVKDIDEILRDPGMKYLFRQHLENEFCAENLDAFVDIRKFLKKMSLLKNLIESKHASDFKTKKTRPRCSDSNIQAAIESALVRQANECLELGYHIYSSYIVVNAPYQLNIDHNLRESINRVMLHASTPSAIESKLGNELLKTCSSIELSATSAQLSDSLSICRYSYLNQSEMNFQSGVHTPKVVKSTTSIQANEEKKRRSTLVLKAKNLLTMKENKLQKTFKILKTLYPLLENVNQDLHRLMRKDSLQKFVTSDLYQDAVTFLEVS